MKFEAEYHALEDCFRRQSEADGAIYLPNPTPREKVDHVLICMEPSLGRWGKEHEQAREKIRRGFRNFLSSVEDFILHYCARVYLCAPGQRYHITDVSKGAMLVQDAARDREARYRRWAPLLRQELELVGRPGATVVAVGKAVETVLPDLLPGVAFHSVIHYSGQAAHARERIADQYPDEFEVFSESLAGDAIVESTRQVLAEARVPPEFAVPALRRVESADLSESRRKLIFAYKRRFERIRGLTSGRR